MPPCSHKGYQVMLVARAGPKRVCTPLLTKSATAQLAFVVG
jgi:hypothetical protein